METGILSETKLTERLDGIFAKRNDPNRLSKAIRFSFREIYVKGLRSEFTDITKKSLKGYMILIFI